MALQSHSSTGWEIQVLKPNGSLRKLCLVKIRSIEKVMPSLCKTRGVSAVLTECSLLGDSEIAARSSHQGVLGQLHVGGLLFFSLLR